MPNSDVIEIVKTKTKEWLDILWQGQDQVKN